MMGLSVCRPNNQSPNKIESSADIHIDIYISGTVIQICLEFDYVLKQPRQPLFDQSLAEKRKKKSEYALFLVHYQLHISEFMILPPLKNSNIVCSLWTAPRTTTLKCLQLCSLCT